MSLLELENITAAYGHVQVLHGVSLRLEPGGATGILGANGAGKTTTLRAICGMVKTTGRIMFDGRDISGLRPEQVAKLGIAHVPEGRGTLARLSVRENLLVGSYLRRDRRAIDTDLDYCFDLFPQLASRSKSTAAALSGGEQQMLAVGRAFMAKPRLLLLDEASLGLAPSTSQDVYAAIARLRRDAALSMVVVEQNAALAFTLVDDATVLETGRSVLSGSQAELMGQESIRRAYLGG
ncbi:MAG TPA: ABC transporter ATP-binding protein [Terrimesophilobacter sp.]|nr:ABC transporter ATP-binding protein [Terrimesophilobacter sp.]